MGLPKLTALFLGITFLTPCSYSIAESSKEPIEFATWDFTASAYVSSPMALEKAVSQGVSITANSYVWGALFVGTEFRYGAAEASNFTYRLVHREMVPSLTLGAHFRSGLAEFGVSSNLGLLVIREDQIRHGSTRIANAGLETGKIRWTTGPNFSLGPFFKLEIIQRLDLVLRGGLNWAYLKVNEQLDNKTSWFGTLGIGYRL